MKGSTMTLPTDSEIYQIIYDTCEANHRSDIVTRIFFRWSNRMTAAMGYAHKKPDCIYYDLTFSIPLFKRATKIQQKQTIIHETCHVLESIIFEAGMSHGDNWKRCMKNAGVSADRLHDIDNTGLIKKYVYSCECGAPHNLSKRKHNLIKNGSVYICNHCKSEIVFTDKITRVDNTV